MFKRTTLSVLAVLAAFAIALPAVAKASGDDTVVAVVNGEKILKKDVLTALTNMSVKSEDTEKAFPMILDQMINERLVDAATAKANVTSDPIFLQRLEATKAQLIKTYYLEGYLKDLVNEKTVRAEYEKFKKENKGKQEVHARHILLSTEAEAKKAIEDLNAGAKFEELAKERSSGPTAKNGGDVGWFAKGEIIPEFSEAAFKLKPGNYSKEPLKSQFGWHVIRVEEKRERVLPAFKDLEGPIRNKLGQEAIGKLVNDLRAKAEIQRFDLNGKPLETPQKN